MATINVALSRPPPLKLRPHSGIETYRWSDDSLRGPLFYSHTRPRRQTYALSKVYQWLGPRCGTTNWLRYFAHPSIIFYGGGEIWPQFSPSLLFRHWGLKRATYPKTNLIFGALMNVLYPPQICRSSVYLIMRSSPDKISSKEHTGKIGCIINNSAEGCRIWLEFCRWSIVSQRKQQIS